MSDGTGIEWTDATWNPLRGCSRVSDGCRNCYAEGVAARFSGAGMAYEGLITKTTQGPKWNGNIMLLPQKLEEPLRWQRPRRIFVNSMSDLFHENVPDDFIRSVFSIMAQARQHTFQVLTKRPERMRDVLTGWEKAGLCLREGYGVRLPNVWLGVSVENQDTADERIPLLLQTPAAIRWLSMEPLLGPVDLLATPAGDIMCRCHGCMTMTRSTRIDWVVVGGESGSKARPMHPAWARKLRDQCSAAGTPFLFKQWGEWLPISEISDTDYLYKPAPVHDPEAARKCLVTSRPIGHDGGEHWGGPQGKCSYLTYEVGKKAAGRRLDGRLHDGYPDAADEVQHA